MTVFKHIMKLLYRLRNRRDVERPGVWYTVGVYGAYYFNEETLKFGALADATWFKTKSTAISAAATAIKRGRPYVLINQHVGLFEPTVKTIWVMSKAGERTT